MFHRNLVATLRLKPLKSIGECRWNYIGPGGREVRILAEFVVAQVDKSAGILFHHQLVTTFLIPRPRDLHLCKSLGVGRQFLGLEIQVRILGDQPLHWKLNWMSGGLRSRGLQVRVLRGAPDGRLAQLVEVPDLESGCSRFDS